MFHLCTSLIWRARGRVLPPLGASMVAAILAACSPPQTPGARSTPAGSGGAVTDHAVSTTGCGHGHTSATFTRTLDVNGLRREYLVHLPHGVPPATPLPAVIYFHGGGRAPAGWLGIVNADSGFSRLADTEKFIAVYPLGSTRPADGRTGWNTGHAPLVTYNPRADDVLFTSRMLDDLQADACVDSARIYATGFSSGGSMIDVLACHLAGRIAAFAPVEGAYFPVPGGCHPARPVSMMSFAGTGDDKVPYFTGGTSGISAGMEPIPQWLSGWARLDRCDQAPSIFFHRHDVYGARYQHCAQGAAIVHYRITGGQHAWPGGTTWLGAPGGTPTINATSLIWSFFKSHRLRPSARR
jgi:polyhydroxybutyrate depolymerase